MAQIDNTALIFASARGCSATVNLLLQAGARMDYSEDEVK